MSQPGETMRFQTYTAPNSSFIPYPSYFKELDMATHNLATSFKELDQNFAHLATELRTFDKEVHRLELRYRLGETATKSTNDSQRLLL